MRQLAGRYVDAWRAAPRDARLYLLAEALAAVAAGAFGTVYNLYLVALGYPVAFVGLLATVAFAGAGLGALAGGRLVDRFGPRRVLLLSSLLAAAGIVAQLALPQEAVLTAGSFVAGAGAAAFYVAAPPFLARTVPPALHADVFSLNTALALAAAAAGSGAAGQAATSLQLAAGVAPLAAYWATLAGAGAVGATSFVALCLTRQAPPAGPGHRRRPDAATRPPAAGWTAALRDRDARRLAVCAALVALGAGLFVPYVNLYFVEELGATAAAFGWISAAAMATRLVATLLAPPLAARAGQARAIGLTQLASVPLLLAVGFSPAVVPAAGAYLVRGALMNMAAPLQLTYRMAVLPAGIHGAGNSLVWLADSATRALSTAAGGALIERVGYRPPYALTAVCYVVAALLFLRWFGGRAPVGRAGGDPGV